jgi:hypothetical protein
MSLSKNSVETLIDLVEIKLSCVEIYDNEDSRTLKHLENCRDELCELIREAPKGQVISFDGQAVA